MSELPPLRGVDDMISTFFISVSPFFPVGQLLFKQSFA